MSLCSGIRADGGRCRAQAIRDSAWCFSHHPDLEEQRRRRGSRGGKRGGRGRADHELVGIKAQLQDLTRDVLAGDLETGRVAVANQCLNTLLRAVEQQRRNKETQELEERISALERASEAKNGGTRWRGGA